LANYIDYEYDKKSEPSKIFVWEQNYETGKIEKIEYDVADYLYFYIDAIDEDKAEPDLTSQRGTKVQKVEADSFKSLKDGSAAKYYRDMGVNTYESDIEPIQKCMLDNYGVDNQKAPVWNIGLYDIETDVLTEQSFMDMREGATQEINAVSVWYSKPDKYYNFTVVPSTLRNVWDYDTIEERGKFTIIYFDNEADMLDAFFDMNKHYEVMALGAWNGDFFDTGYIFNRCKTIWNEKTAASKMGRFPKVRKNKIMLGDKEELLIRPIGLVWYDCLEAYKKNGPELESFALQAVAEEEGLGSKIDFEGNFETLYHGSRKDRERFAELTPEKQIKKLVKKSEALGKLITEELELYEWASKNVETDGLIEAEVETRIQMKITEKLEELLDSEDLQEELGSDGLIDFERYVLYKKFLDTYRLFLDYSNQDSQLLYDLEMKIDKFNTLMMLAQYNVSYFQDVFATLKQVEQGITNFAHLNNKKVVIDRDYEKDKQPYNQHIPRELLRIRMENDYKIMPEDSKEVKLMKQLTSQPKIPGAHVLLPQVGLISYDEEVTPELAREFKELRAQLNEIDKQLEAFEEDE
jgi:hypothetical protein